MVQEWVAPCTCALLCRALVQHVCPDPGASSADVPQGSLAAQFVGTAAALAEAWAHDSKDSGVAGQDAAMCMQQLESCILLGSAAQLQLQLQDGWGILNQLAASSAQQVDADQAQQQQQQDQYKELCVELQQAVVVCWPLLQAWVTATLEAGCLQGPEAQRCQEGQQQPAQWDRLLAVLKQLQQQVQGAVSTVAQPNPLQQDSQAASGETAQAVSAEPRTSSGSSAAASSSLPKTSRQSLTELDSRCQQARQQVLLELCSTVPPLLQPRDLAGPLEVAAGAPDSLVLVVLMRLAAATQHMWQPLLAAASHTTPPPAAAAADAEVTLRPTGTQTTNMARLQLEPVLAAADGAQATADVWQRQEVQQIAAALADESADAARVSAFDASALR